MRRIARWKETLAVLAAAAVLLAGCPCNPGPGESCCAGLVEYDTATQRCCVSGDPPNVEIIPIDATEPPEGYSCFQEPLPQCGCGPEGNTCCVEPAICCPIDLLASSCEVAAGTEPLCPWMIGD